MDEMKKLATIILLIPLLLTACVREVWPGRNGSPDELVIRFGTSPSPDVVISTKGALSVMQESQVRNMYVYVFDSEGNKIFGHYFDESNKDKNVLPNYWTSTTAIDGTTSGTVHIKTQKENGCKIVAICNIDPDMIDISPEYLGTLTTYDAVKGLSIKLNQEVCSRSGLFPMSGEITEGVDLDPDPSTDDPIHVGTMTLRRLDSKIRFKVKASNEKDRLDENGNPVSPVERVSSGIYSFTPTSWQVVNLPKTSYVFEHGQDAASAAAHFFESEETPFETETPDGDYNESTHKWSNVKTYCDGKTWICVHGFSFYMMENRKGPKATPATWNYTHREEKSGDSFTYADDLATYVRIKGLLEIRENGVSKRANVTYTVHLGDFDDDLGDFSVVRNHTYTYNIIIEGVDQIRVSVEKETILEPGASGDILIASGESMICDSHYSTHSLTFNKDGIDNDHLNWWVQTPFNPEGADPLSISLSGIDYKWVEFRVNADKRGSDAGKTYTENAWTSYKPHGSGAVTPDQFKYIVNPDQEGNPYVDPADPSRKISPTLHINELVAFLEAANSDAVSLPDGGNPVFDADGKIVVTVFVNEYYYETNPLTGRYEPELWKRFVNQPTRTMCILSNVNSFNGSNVINSSFTIQQHSIQSVYNVHHPDLNSAWGVEYSVDARENKCNTAYWSSTSSQTRENTDANYGRKNSMVEWNLLNPSWVNDASWSTYLNLDGDSDEALMKSTYAYVRHTCMSRNRDNDGDGMIDMDEVRWYLASSNQLIDLYLGSYGIEKPAALYQRSQEARANRHSGADAKAIWREHVLASNRADGQDNSNTSARVVRAEEAIAGSWYSRTDNSKNVSARCIRNLGYDPVSHRDITYSDENVSTDRLITIRQFKNGQECPDEDWTDPNSYKDVYFEIDCSRVNEKSIRYYTDSDLPRHDENSEAACLYTRFRTTSINGSFEFNGTNSKTMNETVDGGTNPYCPEGYRLPNIREIGIMVYFLDANLGSGIARKYICDKGTYTMARTYYSYGMEGDRRMQNQWGWAIGFNSEFKALMSESSHTTTSIRCVKDIR